MATSLQLCQVAVCSADIKGVLEVSMLRKHDSVRN